ncbi:hypothetical protein LMG26689_03012 [Achromobacter animicus]|nr:hypothetical protein [Achromobacter animicus]CAB3871595.1 hypothetical protein LMG26689_03012 [Achromobacter animicus]
MNVGLDGAMRARQDALWGLYAGKQEPRRDGTRIMRAGANVIG